MKSGIVTVMGSFVVDLMARAPHLPVMGETVKGTTFKIGPGGKGSNQGVAARRSGAKVNMITKLGKDSFAQIALSNFHNEGIDTKYIFQDESYPTGSALIMVDENTSDNKILVVIGACDHIKEQEIESAREVIENCDILLTQYETNIEAIIKAVEIAHKKGVRIIFNPAPAPSNDNPIPAELIKMVDIITPNEVEAGIISGIKIKSIDDAKKSAEKLLYMGAKNIIITLGNAGCLVMTEKEEKVIPRLNVKAIDTTGAGDAFNGGLATAIAEGKDLIEAAEFANIVGALSVTKIGTAPAMPYRGEIDDFKSTL